MAQPVLYRAHPTERLLDAIVVVPVDVFVDQREHLPTGVFLPPLGVDGLDLRPAEETLRGRVVQRTALRARRSGRPEPLMGSSHPGRLWRRPRSECAGGRASSGNVAVDHRRGMRLAVRRLGLGDVRQPLLVGTFGGEVPERSGSHEGGSRLALVGTVPATSGTCAASPSPAMIRLIAFSETPVPGAALILRYP